MLKMEDVVGVINNAMTPQQAEALARILHGDKATQMQALKLAGKANRFEAHRILTYVLSHNMSDDHNADYVREALGLDGSEG